VGAGDKLTEPRPKKLGHYGPSLFPELWVCPLCGGDGFSSVLSASPILTLAPFGNMGRVGKRSANITRPPSPIVIGSEEHVCADDTPY
jgi:hypothetical protein